jgi:hypothetical protein
MKRCYALSIFLCVQQTTVVDSMAGARHLLQRQLAHYYEKFSAVAGISYLMRVIQSHTASNNDAGIRALLFELETADWLQQQGHVIRGFDITTECTPVCEFDVLTDRVGVECKSGRCASRFRACCKQFGKQHVVAQRLGLEFFVHFKQQPHKAMEQWLKEHKIHYSVAH